MADDWIDETCNTDAIKDIATESATADHRTRSNSRGCISKRILEYPVCQNRNTCCTISIRDILKEEPACFRSACKRSAAPSNKAISLSEHECITYCIKQ